MPRLADVQAAMAAALLQGDDAAARPLVDAPEGLDIHRNTVEGVLTGALRLSFPAVGRLVGPAFFDAMGLAFARRHPPDGGCLDDWGGGLARFIEGFAPAARLPYLADVARLEWAMFIAANAADSPPLVPARARLPLRPHPSFSLVRVGWPAEAVRQAVMKDDFATLKLEPAPGWLAVHRLGDEVAVRRLDDDAAAFTLGLFEAEPFAAPPAEAHLALLAEHLALGCFQEEPDDRLDQDPDRAP